MKLLFYHGWGFDSAIWEGVASQFSDSVFSDRGYFGAPREPDLAGEFVAVTHSFGTMRLLAAIPPDCRGIVAINGFDRFAASDEFPGVSPRIVERMIKRFGETPGEVLAEFRKHCGSDAAFAAFDPARLLEDLEALRDGDCRENAAACALPILSVQGARDPLLPLAMREAVFAASGRCERRTHESGGHLLPLQEPAYCAKAVCAFMERLT